MGPPRVTNGTAYFEYQAEIKAMKEPLPRGAEYPQGVPEGLNVGPGTGGMAEIGSGRNLAHFTWLCAWESEHLTAISEKDAERQVEAESMLAKWSTSSFYLNVVSDPDTGWVRTVLDRCDLATRQA
jgi:hypothetical protein